MPVIPLVIRGSRQVLPSESWLPRPGKLEIVVTPALHPAGSDGVAAETLKQTVRLAMLQELNEPDMEIPPRQVPALS